MEEIKENINQAPDSRTAEPKGDQAAKTVTPEKEVKGKGGWTLGKIFQSIMAGTFLSRENFIRTIPYIFFLALLGLIYIANTYYAEKTVRAIDHTKRELKELRYEHITVKSDLMFVSKQSEVSKRLEGTGLKPIVSPPSMVIKETQPEPKKK